MSKMLDLVTSELSQIFVLSVAAFVLAMILTPIYTHIAYRYKFWKTQRYGRTATGV